MACATTRVQGAVLFFRVNSLPMQEVTVNLSKQYVRIEEVILLVIVELDWMTQSDAARRFGVSRSLIWWLVQHARVVSYSSGKTRYVSVRSLEGYFAKGRKRLPGPGRGRCG